MLYKTIKYQDYDGNMVEEKFTFNLSQAELAKMQLGTSGGVEGMINRIIKNRDSEAIIDTIDKMILMSYGEKSPDGKRFIKSEELSKAFQETEAYSVLFMELVTDAKKAAEFFNAVVPPEVAAAAKKTQEEKGLPILDTKIIPPEDQNDQNKVVQMPKVTANADDSGSGN